MITERRIYSGQLDQRIAADYHREVDETKDEYSRRHRKLIDTSVSGLPQRRELLVVVETRIPFFRQAALLGISLDPALYIRPRHQSDVAPYSLWCRTVGGLGSTESSRGSSLNEMMASLPHTLKPTTPLEGIAYPFESVQDLTSLAFPGGDTEGEVHIWGGPPKLALCLERYQHSVRVSHTRLDQFDSLVSMLVARDKNYVD